MKKKRHSTSWESSNQWYEKCVGDKGHYYHQKVILPKILDIIKSEEKKEVRLLDLACGSGVLQRAIPKSYSYHGIDLSASLLKYAKEHCKNPKHVFSKGDITQPLLKETETFDVVCIILALQNIEHPKKVLQNAYKHLKPDGKFIAVLNHPCFRIPRQSSWEADLKNKVQYRRVNRYMTKEKIPIQTHPSQKTKSPLTYTFHLPLSGYFSLLHEVGFSVQELYEWCSDKKSQGARAKMEDRARKELPLFLTWVAKK